MRNILEREQRFLNLLGSALFRLGRIPKPFQIFASRISSRHGRAPKQGSPRPSAHLPPGGPRLGPQGRCGRHRARHLHLAARGSPPGHRAVPARNGRMLLGVEPGRGFSRPGRPEKRGGLETSGKQLESNRLPQPFPYSPHKREVKAPAPAAGSKAARGRTSPSKRCGRTARALHGVPQPAPGPRRRDHAAPRSPEVASRPRRGSERTAGGAGRGGRSAGVPTHTAGTFPFSALKLGPIQISGGQKDGRTALIDNSRQTIHVRSCPRANATKPTGGYFWDGVVVPGRRGSRRCSRALKRLPGGVPLCAAVPTS